MKKIFSLILAILLFLTVAGCAARSNQEAEVSDSGTSDGEVSASAPSAPPESSSQPAESGSSADASRSNESAGEPGIEGPDNTNPITQTVPGIDASVFYDEGEGGANLSVLCTGVGRYWLSYENSKSLLAYLDFSRLTPTDQSESLEIDSPDPGIVFTASDFSYELRLDQNTNIAVYEIGGSTRYYYTMPEGFYDTAFEWATTYAQYNYSADEEEAFNAVTGHNPDAEGN